MSRKKEVDFGGLLEELEGIVNWFESDDVDLNLALKKYERGLELVAELKSRLKSTKNEIKKIEAKFSDADK